ncbi:MAG: tRNA threonylcarbamoyladenosine dehydratase [Ruminococcaceae bacterium]|nr:tRNA threonylcarbamoyladenosine dehydratase [Oscillospiraceae bacterium]
MKEEFSRTEKVIGSESVNKLNAAKVAVFGVGGVGGHAAEALVRAGIGRIDLIDFDTVSVSNINRQIVALHSTVGKKKVDVLKERFLDINNSLCINTYDIFYNEETEHLINLLDYDYIIDAIDSVSAKIHLIKSAYEKGVPIISSMGTGNKLDATAFKVADIYKTNVCPLAKVMRYELKKVGVKKLKCVYSEEPPVIKATPPGSMPYVPATAGLILAGEVIKDIVSK